MCEAEQSAKNVSDSSLGRRNIVLLQSGDALNPVFCVHASDGDVVSYLQLARELLGAAQTYGITALDLEMRTPLPRSVPEMAEYYADQVQRIPRRGPICLVGWSSGAWIAFEVANALVRRGEAVRSVTVLDSPPPGPDELSFDLPQSVRALGLTGDAERSAVSWWRFLCTHTLVDRDAHSIPSTFWTMSDDAKCRTVFEQVRDGNTLRAFNTLLAATDARDMMYMLDILRMQYEAFSHYEGSSFGGRVNLFVALRAGIGEPQCQLRIDLLEDYWRSRSAGTFKSYHIVGDHSAPLYPPAVQDVARVILE